MNILRTAAASAALAAVLALAVPAQAQQQLAIATGGTGGVYYPLGGGIAELINRHLDGYSAVAEVTGASIENIPLVMRGESDIAIVLGDSAVQAVTGTGAFEGREAADLRILMALYPNAMHVVVPAESDIHSLADLRGRRISVGAPGSGTQVNALALLTGNGITYDDLAAANRFNSNETADALRDGDIDAGIWSVGPPTSSIMNLAASRSIRLLPLSPEEVAGAQSAEPIFAPFTLRAGLYEGQDEDVQSIAIPNLLVASADMDEDLAYSLTRMIFEHVDDLIAIHASARDITVEFTLAASSIPLHPGAIRYYEEIGAEVPDHLRP